MQVLPNLVEQVLKNRFKLESYIDSLLEQVGTEIAESIAREHGVDRSFLVERHVRPVVDTHIDREFLSSSVHPICQGKFRDQTACTHKALPNGFCRLHADQYTAFNARQRALREFMRVRQANPSHTHPPCVDLVPGCPMCEQKRKQGNPFLMGRQDCSEIPWK